MRDSSVEIWSAVHRFLYRLTGGTLGRRLVNNDILLLTTVGRKTGRLHTVPLLFLEDGESLVVIASYGGRDRHPDWYLNLVERPSVHAQIRGTRRSYQAHTATPMERAGWWPRVIDAYGGYAEYQTRTTREIPVVILEPAFESPPPSAGRS
jgi:deazaflavin-dependent oxidoreductase (nitroreductase family)